ncbi:amino acid ABC transporter ATP-binding protein [Lentilactobacillus buchneri]|uniref:ABC-type polar amino acid transport system, ATPase component n=1 Tax=Lentilactobacillus buchneri subsp. silagei CD034 TaxID=1071400 RepID=J9W0J3_LENBU|nr:amino acid ABC transporter ATP-binding protein [Lentilactobacillus buchneri]MCC6100455.1 amino acid ABC transporter ATP-binding protein [Lactobacillus sp.]AFS00083.1 ABC-type polar amino acid transport system, ATPase component [Lentilactobacillus buchneri subsp. silagei CD034]MCT2900538.1 amino acid ABC transporter ATP-binding protein [Lentilactobacillus buchneri]MCT3541549.1 amino acid ABC transporter ATP-binding protein [Lentilactobacillus buchneri]MCT3544825.1 amino acid ABC transporter 
MLEIKNLTKRFGSRTIIDDLSMTVKDNEIMAIVGPSGAGKTTLLRCITGLESVNTGEFYWNGTQFDPTNTTQKDTIIGVVFQDYQLFPNLTVLGNITLAPTMVKKETMADVKKYARELLSRLGLEGKENLYPYQLSGGQKQRVAIVRALAMRPKILCYDEPTSALDPALRDEVAQIILDLKKQEMTQIVVTHDMDFAKNVADEIQQVKQIQ